MGLKQQFRIKAGKHSFRGPDGKLKTLNKGTIVASVNDLTEIFPEKFEKVAHDDPALSIPGMARAEELIRKREEAPAPPPVEEEADTPVIVKAEDPEEAPDYGTEVTTRFPKLEASSLSVFYNGDNYTVKKDNKVLATALEDKASVMNWFKEWKKSK